jgi:predicted  nucleic acid-binding Zn-ribbon protein
MWKQVYEYARDWLTISREVQENKTDIKDVKLEVRELRDELQTLREDFTKLIFLVQKFSFDIQEVSTREESERKNLALQLENEMLKFERRLPQGKDTEK